MHMAEADIPESVLGEEVHDIDILRRHRVRVDNRPTSLSKFCTSPYRINSLYETPPNNYS